MNTPAPMIETEGRSLPEWIGRNADDPIPDRVRVRVFLRFNGICQECETKITTKRWVCDHRVAIINGGANRERNLGPIHEACDKKIKTPRDMKIKAKIYRIQKRNLGVTKPRTIRAWRRFDGTPVYAGRAR